MLVLLMLNAASRRPIDGLHDTDLLNKNVQYQNATDFRR